MKKSPVIIGFLLISLLMSSSVISSPRSVPPVFADNSVNNSTELTPPDTKQSTREKVQSNDENSNVAKNDEQSRDQEKPQPNRQPKADAGRDVVVNSGDKVVLNAEKSTDADNDKLSFIWTQVSPKNPKVKLTSSNSVKASFIAPKVSRATIFNFLLSAKDSAGAETKDSVSVGINKINHLLDLKKGQSVAPKINPKSLQSQGSAAIEATAATGTGSLNINFERVEEFTDGCLVAPPEGGIQLHMCKNTGIDTYIYGSKIQGTALNDGSGSFSSTSDVVIGTYTQRGIQIDLNTGESLFDATLTNDIYGPVGVSLYPNGVVGPGGTTFPTLIMCCFPGWGYYQDMVPYSGSVAAGSISASKSIDDSDEFGRVKVSYNWKASLSFKPINNKPTANSQTISTNEGTAKNIILTGSDPDNDKLSFIITSGPSHGSLTGTAPSVTYTPTSGYSGPDGFTFKVNDGKEDSDNVATVSIIILQVINHPPVASAKSVPSGSALVGESVKLDGGDSTDPDLGDSIVNYKWSQIDKSGAFVFIDQESSPRSTSTFKAPDYVPTMFSSVNTPPGKIPLEFSLVVTDKHQSKSTNEAKARLDIKCSPQDQATAERARDILIGAINIPGASIKSPQTAENFRYFLSGAGDIVGKSIGLSSLAAPPKPLSINFLEGAGEFRKAQDTMGKQIENDVKDLLHNMKNGDTAQWVKSYPYDITNKEKIFLFGHIPSDWVTAVGAANTFAHVDLTVKKIVERRDSSTVSGTIRFEVRDIFDFNPGKTFRVPFVGEGVSEDMYQTIKCLGARNFDQHTFYSKIFTDVRASGIRSMLDGCLFNRDNCEIRP